MPINDALVEVYRSNPNLLAERAKLRATDEQMAQANAMWRPTAQWTTTKNVGGERVSGGTAFQNEFYSGQNPSGTFGVTVTQPLFRGGRTLAATKKAMATIRAERAKLTSVEQKVLLAAVGDYCDVVRDAAALDLQLHNQQYLSQKVASSQAQFKGGEMSRTDVAQAESALQQAIAQRATAESNLEKSRMNFARDVGLPADALAYPSKSLRWPETMDEAIQLAGTQNPEVVSAQYALEAAREDIADTVGQALPQAELQGQVERIDGGSFASEHEDIFGVTLHINIPLYSGGTLESQSRAAMQSVTMYSNQILSTRRTAEAEASTAWAQISAYRNSVAAYTEQVRANEIAAQGVQHQQTSGERTLLDVLNAQQALLQSRTNLNAAQHDEVVAEYSLLAALGLATAQGLRLPVKLYDPDSNYNDVKDRWFGFGISN